MTKNKTLTLDEIIDAAMERGIMQEHRLTTTTREQEIAYKRQQFLQWVADTCIGDDSDTPNVMIAMEHNRQRQILRAAGWKPSDKEDG